ncbi:amino acid adenylation domain-containing protein [Actinomadura spongiicola]|uniref:Phenyloxazoline synthase MbtB n=1 Tax=Actinomadura spongiicola TaxID=2303421 RepID=A0A372GG11_9ACTN|nr:non-ribosomal peptide synthetase [Actinomadura spongiicola]RFS84314.1 amino acid adenylation domain-containing protein [Actinomadura spongiicola]
MSRTVLPKEIESLLGDLDSRGLRLTATGSDLRLQGPRERMDPDLIGRIKANKAELISHLAAAAEAAEARFPLTPLQRGYLLGRDDIFEMGNVANHVYQEIEGHWDLDRLEAALAAVVRRHGMLRTGFTDDGQAEDETVAAPRIARVDLRDLSDDERRRRRLELREERSHRMLPLDRPPLIAVEATTLADDRMVLHVSNDGLVMDGISAMLFMREWWAAYQGEPVRHEATPFASYVAALEAARTRGPAERSREYWYARLDDLPPHPDLPLRAAPAEITEPRFVPRTVRLDATPWATLKATAGGHGLTPSGLLLAAYAETLAAWGAGSAFTVTTTVADRPPIHPHILDTIGAFSDTMLVEIALDHGDAFAQRARSLQARLRRDLDHRHFSGVEVMREISRRYGSARARMPFTFNSAIGYPFGDLDGSTFELFGPRVYTVSQTPQVWVNVFAFEQHGGLVVQVDGVDELFPEGLLDDVVAGYQALLLRLLDDDAWAAKTFDLMPEAQRARRREANDTAVAPTDEMLPDAFTDQAARTPDAPAIITSRRTMSYGELLARARHAAAWLRERAAGRDELVGLVMTRGPEQIIGILATLMAGAAYLPVDAGLPERRRAYMLRDGRVRLVLTNGPAEGITVGDDPPEVLRLDAAQPPPNTVPAAVERPPGAGPDDLAYVLYTSGTTGDPKGVMVGHRSVVNVVADCNERFGVAPRDRFFGVSAFNFDLSVYDVFGALGAGAAIVLPDHERATDAAHWLELCGTAGVTVWNSVPAIVSLLRDQAAADGAEALATLRLVMMSGDRIPPTLPPALRELKADLRLVSLGGPTETTIWNILHPIGPGDDGSRSVPYGRPNAGNRAYVLGPHGQDMPDWVTGEICAAGVGLARGYWGDEERTAERFRWDDRRGERLYRTGDLGRYLPNGEIEIVGRADHQVKVNGHRIEAGEVETRLTAIEAVRQAVVVRQEGARGERLVAHLVAAGAERPPDARLGERLRAHLPDYMIPSAYVWHESLPLTRNGKVDRTSLTATGAVAGVVTATGTGAAGPATDLEQQIAELWASVLELPDVPPEVEFGELGGDSIAAATIATGVRKRYGLTIPLHRLPEVATVRAMATYIEREGR